MMHMTRSFQFSFVEVEEEVLFLHAILRLGLCFIAIVSGMHHLGSQLPVLMIIELEFLDIRYL